MPTNPAILSPEKAQISRHTKHNLCASLSRQSEKTVAACSLPGSPAILSLRPLSLDIDIPTITHWMGFERRTDPARNAISAIVQLEEVHASIQQSNIAQAFMGLVNDVPVCQLDICHSRQHELSIYYPAREGDYILNLLMAPLCVQDQMIALLRTTLRYFFAFSEVSRIVTDVEHDNEWIIQLYKKAGFQLAGRTKIPYKTAHLYTCTRDSLATAF